MKKFLAILLALVLSLTLLAACGGDNGAGEAAGEPEGEIESVAGQPEETGLQELPAEISGVEFDEDGEVSFFYKEIYPMGSLMLDNYHNGTISQETAETDADALGFADVDSMLSYFDELVEYLQAHQQDYQ